MTNLEKAARQALEALSKQPVTNHGNWILVTEAITALRDALAEQAEQEPVVKYYGEKLVKGSKVFALLDRDLAPDTLLYAAPVRTKDLTDSEIVAVATSCWFLDGTTVAKLNFARDVIAADREKNK